MTRIQLVQFLLLGAIWGSSYTSIKAALPGLSPSQLVLSRLALGLVVLAAVLMVQRVRLSRSRAVWGHVAVASVLGMLVPFLLLGYGEQRTSAAMAGLLIAVMPLATLAAASVLLPTEQVTWRKATGFAIGFVGVALIVAPWRADPGELTGQLAVVAAAVSYAAQTVYIKRFLVAHGLSPVALAAGQVITALALQSVTLPAFGWQTPQLSWPVVLGTLLLGVFGTGIAYVLYFRLVTELGAATASSVNYLVPVVGVVAGATLLGDGITGNMIVGGLAVMAGLAVAEGRLGHRPRHGRRGGHRGPNPAPGVGRPSRRAGPRREPLTLR